MLTSPWQELVHPAWADALAPVADRLDHLTWLVRREVAEGHGVLPEPEHILRAFDRPPGDVRVLLLGQDPYPTPGHAVGLSFSVAPGTRPMPRSLVNIFRELAADTGVAPPADGDLTGWADRGVMLLNRVLTVRPGQAGSHRRLGWEAVTDQAVRTLASRGSPLVAVLWGRDAQTIRPLLGATPVVASAHPSPLSASRGFLGSRPFSQVDALLAGQGAAPMDWSLP